MPRLVRQAGEICPRTPGRPDGRRSSWRAGRRAASRRGPTCGDRGRRPRRAPWRPVDPPTGASRLDRPGRRLLAARRHGRRLRAGKSGAQRGERKRNGADGAADHVPSGVGHRGIPLWPRRSARPDCAVQEGIVRRRFGRAAGPGCLPRVSRAWRACPAKVERVSPAKPHRGHGGLWVHDREVIAWALWPARIGGNAARDLMLLAVERRFGQLVAPAPVEWWTDNGSVQWTVPRLPVGKPGVAPRGRRPAADVARDFSASPPAFPARHPHGRDARSDRTQRASPTFPLVCWPGPIC